jgi:hypothetical protein
MGRTDDRRALRWRPDAFLDRTRMFGRRDKNISPPLQHVMRNQRRPIIHAGRPVMREPGMLILAEGRRQPTPCASLGGERARRKLRRMNRAGILGKENQESVFTA